MKRENSVRTSNPLSSTLMSTVQSIATNEVSRNTILLTLSSLSSGFGTFIFWFLAARLYTPDTVGVASAGTSALLLLAGLSHLSLGTGLLRYSNLLGPQRGRIITTIFVATVCIAATMGAIFAIVFPNITPGLAPLFASSWNISFFILSCVACTVSLQYDSYLMSRRLFLLMLVKNVAIVSIRLILLYVFPYLSFAMLVAITGISTALGLVSVFPFVAMKRRYSDGLAKESTSLGALVRFSLWNHIVGLATTTLPLALPTIVISTLDGTQAAAFYMSWSMFSVLLLLPVAFSTVVFIERANAPKNGHRKSALTEYQSDLVMIAVTLLSVPVIALALVLLGPTYIRYGFIALLVLTLSVFPNKRITLLITELRMVGSQRALALACGSSQIAVIAASIPFAHLMGIAGPAAAWTLGQYILFIWLAWLKKETHTRDNLP